MSTNQPPNAQTESTDDRFRSCFEHSPFGVIVFDAAGLICEVNPAACEMTGYTETELLTLSVANLHPPEYQEDVRNDCEKLRTGGRLQRERPFVGKADRTGWFRLDALKVSDDRFLGYVSNVTRLKQTEQALTASEERLRLFIEHVPAGVAMLDRKMRYLTCSQRWLSDYGLVGQNIIGRSHYDVFPEIPERWKEMHRRCLTGQTERCEEDPFQRQDGSTQFIRWEVEPWLNSTGAVGGLVMFAEEITNRVLAERALRISEQQLAEARVVAHLGSWVWDIVSDKMTWCDEVYRIYGHEPQSFTPCRESDLLAAVHPDDRQNVTTAVEEALKQKLPYSVNHRIVRPDGTERVVHEQGTVEYDSSDRPVRMSGVVQDITAHMQVEEQFAVLREQLAHAARVGTLGELASGLAHELNQPLTAIHLQAHTATLLADRLDTNADAIEKLRKALDVIGEQSLRAGDIVRRIRSFIRHHEPNRERCDVSSLLKDVLKLMENELRLKKVHLELRLSSPMPLLFVDGIQIQQVLVNLIQNSVDAMEQQDEQSRQISIQCVPSGEGIVVRVADTGTGLTPEAAAHVFDAFHTTKTTGLGLGLPICRSLIEAHGGTIAARPGTDGGAVVEFYLPPAEDEEAPGQRRQSA